eukprot:TRINITY_DN5998_c0_g1_i2.p1 TRINITY_DN5998_c0_g1~~TRINITY_DN5998_c0_g1_i2.p1  ORF type:complete len:238 (-),score=32.98 TRINITY_DN5998_c0_g1_i2:415-1128(-)
MAKSGEVRSAGKTSHYYHMVEGILYRVFKKGTQSWEQVVVPTSLRSSVLAVSHDTILSGHCGARRTLCRLREKFDWPGVTVDVAKYVTSCDVCQRVIPKGKVPPVPLASVPLVGVPFHRVAIDLVGPIKPASEQGHRFILTLVDVATRYPEAIPMKDISSSSVAKALLNIFSSLILMSNFYSAPMPVQLGWVLSSCNNQMVYYTLWCLQAESSWKERKTTAQLSVSAWRSFGQSRSS